MMTTGWMSYDGVSKPASFSCGSLFSVCPGSASLVEHELNLMMVSGLALMQLNNNLTSQAATMSTHGFPNDVLSNLDPLALVIFIPIFDLVVSTLFLLCTPGVDLTHHLILLFIVLPSSRSTENRFETFAEACLGLLRCYCSDDMGSCCPALYLRGTVYFLSDDELWI